MTDINTIDFEADVQETTEDKKTKIVFLAKRLTEAKTLVDNLEEDLKAAKRDYDDLRYNQLPIELMTSGIESISIDGYEISVRASVRASMKGQDDVESRKRAAEWLKAQGRDALVKKSVILDLNRESAEEVARIAAVVRERFQQFEVKESYDVHHSTLSAAIREMLKNEETVPTGDEIGINLVVGNEAKVTKKRL